MANISSINGNPIVTAKGDDAATTNYAHASVVANDTDFDSLTTPGNYRVSNVASAQTMGHIPVQAGGRLLVASLNSASSVVQIYKAASGDANRNVYYVRELMASTWTSWVRVDPAGTNKRASESLALTSDYATVLANGTDYNTLTTAGQYTASTNASAASMVNCPVAVAHSLIVLNTTASTRFVQILFGNNSVSPLYYRYGTGRWVSIVPGESIVSGPAIISSDNKANYFTDCNDAPLNSIYSVYANAQLDNSPAGPIMVSDYDVSPGYPAGTLATLKGGSTGGLTWAIQIFAWDVSSVGQSIMSFRTARTSGGALVWSPWSSMSDHINLSASNVVIRESMITHGNAPFADCDDAPTNSIYQVDLDCVSLAHNPLSGHSSVLVTLGFSFVSRHGMIQASVGLLNGEASMYLRYGYINGPNDYRWTAWRHVVTEEAV